MGDELKVIIPLDSYRKIMACVDLVETEVTGFADVEYSEESKNFTVGEVYILDQTASGADVEMDEEKIADFNFQMINGGKTQLPRCWWHSHVNMSVFFSGTDETAIENLKNESFTLAIVFNKRREVKADVVLWKPFYYRWKDLEVVIDYSSFEVPEELKKEIADKVKPEKKAIQIYSNNGKKGKKNKGYQTSIDEDGYSWRDYGNGIHKFVRRQVRTLPKDNELAEKVIWQNGLAEVFDKELEEDVWASEDRTIIYRDKWSIVRPWPLFTNQPVDEILDAIEKKNKK